MLMPAVAWVKGTCMLMTMSLPYSRGGSPGAPIDAEVRHLGMTSREARLPVNGGASPACFQGGG